ncbi:titin [Fopius arisanus]|uniref:Titin n=1 Tax=Fopius arisanus TaxID=64838 RepID=A0A9R1TYB3_9HYME|nr:PREDICTED: titin [Fopius arisanus]
MSEPPKMGVLGSKEEDKSVDGQMGKEDSPYDTEALSIMDINDIIGVQTEPVGDSTLEGEMAALSAMITEGKTDDPESEIPSTVEKEREKDGSKEESTINKSLQLIGEAYISEDSQEVASEGDEVAPKVVFSCKLSVDKRIPPQDATGFLDLSSEDLKDVDAEVSEENPLSGAEGEEKPAEPPGDDVPGEGIDLIPSEGQTEPLPPVDDVQIIPEVGRSEGKGSEEEDLLLGPEDGIETADEHEKVTEQIPEESSQVEEVEASVEEMLVDASQDVGAGLEPMEVAGEDQPDKTEILDHLESSSLVLDEVAGKGDAPAGEINSDGDSSKDQLSDLQVEKIELENGKIQVEEEIEGNTPDAIGDILEEVTSLEDEKERHEEGTSARDSEGRDSLLEESEISPAISQAAVESIDQITGPAEEEGVDEMEECPVEEPDKMEESVVEEPDAMEDSAVEEPDKMEESAVEELDKMEESVADEPDKMEESAIEEPEKMDEFSGEEPETSSMNLEEESGPVIEVSENMEEVIPDVPVEAEVEEPPASPPGPPEENLKTLDIHLKEGESTEGQRDNPRETEETTESAKAVDNIPDLKDLPEASFGAPEEPPEKSTQEPPEELLEAPPEKVPDVVELPGEILEEIEISPAIEETSKQQEEISQQIEETPNKMEEVSPQIVETSNKIDEISLPIEETLDKMDEISLPIEETSNKITENSPQLQEPTDSPPGSPPTEVGSLLTTGSAPEEVIENPGKTEEMELDPMPAVPDTEDLFEDAMESLEGIQPEGIIEEGLGDDLKSPGIVDTIEEPEQAEILDSPPKLLENSFNLDQQEKIDIPDELLADLPEELDPLASNPEISELECAVKFLQESEEQEIESPLVLSPKLVENVEPELPQSFPPGDEDQVDLEAELDHLITDPIAISEAEIISEAVKLESEKKQKEEAKISIESFPAEEEVKQDIKVEVKAEIEIKEEIEKNDGPEEKKVVAEPVTIAASKAESSELLGDPKPTGNLPKISILEERLREPPKIEIPTAEPRICDTPMTPKTSLLIQRDAKIYYHKMLDSPQSQETKIPETRKDHDKHDIDNIGSPRIILKIPKSAIADCSEPRSPKSPKIRSAANSPNPEDSPGQKLGKIRMKLSRSGHPSIISNETEEPQRGDSSLSPLGMKIKLGKSGDASIIQSEKFDPPEDKRLESPLGMKIKLPKSGEAPSIIPQDFKDLQKHKIDMQQSPKRTESPLPMKFKLLKTGDASIIQQVDRVEDETREISPEVSRRTDSPQGVKMKISKKSGASILDPLPSESHNSPKDKLELPEMPRRTESPLSITKIKLSKSGDATIIHPDVLEDNQDKNKIDVSSTTAECVTGVTSPIGVKIKLTKTGDAMIIHPDKEEDVKEPHPMKIKLSTIKSKTEGSGAQEIEGKEVKIIQKPLDPGIESMKIKLSKTGHHTIVSSETDKSKDLIEVYSSQNKSSEVTIEPINPEDSLKRRDTTITSPVEAKKYKMETKLSHILPEVTIQPLTPKDHRPHPQGVSAQGGAISRQQMNVINREISITQVRSLAGNFNSIIENEAEDVEIIEPHPELIIVNENSNSSQDVMIIEEVARIPEVKIPKKRGRPRRQPVVESIPRDPLALDVPMRSVEPKENERPKRTCSRQKSYAPPKRGRGRGRGKRKLDRTDYVVTKKPRIEQNLTIIENRTTALINLDDEGVSENSAEIYKVLRNPQGQGIGIEALEIDGSRIQLGKGKLEDAKEGKDTFGAPDRQNWLTPTSKKLLEGRSDISTVQVIDEETRMSAESFSRSQTPARSIGAHAGETIINEESQGSVVSTATTESEKVKVKNRRMEINFDPDEGPFTVEKIAEYEWPADRKGDTFMIQEQISQYLGVKSFKRKYPDLKRRMVDMEERNHLRENGLVSESMCDMGLTAVCSSEVLDIMCSDFPDQYEEYRKHMREKQIKEHSKKQKELTAAANAEKNRIDLAEMAVQSAMSWNAGFNKARKESRKCSLDLQTFTIHVPKKQQKIEENTNVSHYPVAFIPGQYTDYYREYTPAELRYYPLNTVLYGPMRPNVRKFDSQSEGSQSDSDSDSSSDDSSSSSSEGTQDTEGSQSTMDDVDIDLSSQKDKSLKCKMCLKNLNKFSKPELQIQCGTCNGYVHPSCIDLTLDMVPHIQAYAWQCTDCKTCAQCHDPADEDKMLFCDMCDRGYHIYCVGLRRVPQGRWHCQECAMCASCGSREPGGMCAERNSVAQWQHEYKKGDKNTRVYVSTLCVPCSKLFGEQGPDNKSEKLPV